MKKTKKNTLKKRFVCIQCGRCCLKYGFELPATEEDILLWKQERRKDILNWVDCGDLWINQKADEAAIRCPWLRKLPNKNIYICRIYELRPEICREYPHNKKRVKEEKCPGYWQ